MKTKNIFLAITLLSLTLLSCNPSNKGGNDKEYTTVLNELMTDKTVATAMNFNMQETSEALIQRLTSKGIEKPTAEAKVNEFINKELTEINIKHLLPYCKKNLSIDELRTVKKLYNNEEYQMLNNLSMEAQMKNMPRIANALTAAMMSIAAGNTPAPIRKSGNYSDKYLSLCIKNAEATNTGNLIDNAMTQLQQIMGTDTEGKRVVKEFGTYFRENLGILLANMYYGTLNEENLENLIRYTQTPAMQKFIKTNIERGANMEEYMNETNKKIQEFITETTKK